VKLGACARLVLRPITGTWYRALEPQFLPTCLSTEHTPDALSRFCGADKHATRFELLYLSENLVVFPAKLQPGSRLEFEHPETGLKQVIEPPKRRRGTQPS
jgi:hypothetical protein